ncbi:MAG: hypothetical protein ACKOWF_02160 [Chloroflexota bacterium]
MSANDVIVNLRDATGQVIGPPTLNDVIVNLRNATGQSLPYRFRSPVVHHATFRDIAPGQESGFAAGLTAGQLQSTAELDLELPDPRTGHRCTFTARERAHLGPEVALECVAPDSRPVQVVGARGMGENDIVDAVHGGYRFHVHRWRDGKEQLDDYRKWYTRFFFTLSNA